MESNDRRQTQAEPEEGPEHAIEMLKKDHQKVKDLYQDFEEAADHRAKRDIVEAALHELKMHTAIEEEIFYPAVRREIDDDELMDEALEEHHAAKLLIEELEGWQPRDERFDAKFTVLIEMVKHHIEEEEDDLFPTVESLGLDLEELGHVMKDRRDTRPDEFARPRAGRRPSNRTPRGAMRAKASSSPRKSRTPIPAKKRRAA